MWADHHSDTDVFLFSDLDTAIEWAWLRALEFCGDYPEDLEFKDYRNDRSDWLYRFTYSCEEDRLWICEKKVNNPLTMR